MLSTTGQQDLDWRQEKGWVKHREEGEKSRWKALSWEDLAEGGQEEAEVVGGGEANEGQLNSLSSASACWYQFAYWNCLGR